MKRYREQFAILILAAILHLGFTGQKPEKTDKLVDELNVSEWLLNPENLTGDTVINVAYDPYFKTAKSYRAYPLNENLLANLEKEALSGNIQVIFNCTDGYRPHMPLQQVLASRGFLAYKDQALSSDQYWADSLSKKFSPFYLVWPEESASDKTFATPYGLISIEFKRTEEEFSAALPKDESLMEGFELFSNTCMRCHSLNKVGGTMAPELNYPKNITEYWTKENIWAFIQEPTSFRFNSKMPAIKHIDKHQFDKIYDYLVSMKDTHKP